MQDHITGQINEAVFFVYSSSSWSYCRPNGLPPRVIILYAIPDQLIMMRIWNECLKLQVIYVVCIKLVPITYEIVAFKADVLQKPLGGTLGGGTLVHSN